MFCGKKQILVSAVKREAAATLNQCVNWQLSWDEKCFDSIERGEFCFI
jgi:hypothetical protein